MTPERENRTIERASTEDLDELLPLFGEYRKFYRRPVDPRAERDFLEARFEAGDSVVFLARDDGAAVGFVQLYPTFSSVRMRRLWILNDLFVDPSARGRGLGRELMRRAREHAERTGAAGLLLETEKSNDAAAALYRSLGWEKETEFDRYELFLE